MKVEKDTMLTDILKNEQMADILAEVGMHCLTCPAAQFDTLEGACAEYGIDVDEIVEKLNEIQE